MDITKVSEFETYLDKVVLPATEDLEQLSDSSRKHIQKLIYTNLVDRFDAMVDGLLLANCRSDFLLSAVTGNMTQPITEAELVRILIRSDDLQAALDDKLQMALRNSLLRDRHSKKLASVFNAFEASEYASQYPRVNPSTGAWLAKITPQNKKVPYSVCGYADWLYCRRNAVVHGAGTSRYLKNDRMQLKKLYKCVPAQTFKIKPSSVRVAATFYKNVADTLSQYEEQNEA